MGATDLDHHRPTLLSRRLRLRAGGASWRAALLLVAVLAVAAPMARAADPIQRVEVRLTVDGGDPHPLVVRRLVESIGTAAERLLIGRDSEVVARQETALAGVLREVVDRVVRGYRVQALTFQTAATTAVIVQVEPRPPILPEVPVVTRLDAVHPDAHPLVRTVLDPALPELRRLTLRLPMEALEWAGPILERRITEVIENTAAGFTATGRVETAPVARLVVAVAPRDSRVIRDVGVRFRSSSIPYALLNQHGPQVTSMAELLRGLPVVFATAHRMRLEEAIAAQLAAYAPAREYSVIARPVLQVAEVTYVTVLADSTVYRGRLEARLNVGTVAPVPDVRVQLGRAWGSIEPFVELTLIPSNLAFRWATGVRVELGSDVTVGLKARLDGGDQETFITYRLSPDMQVRGAYFMRTEYIETTLTFRLNEFLSLEAVAASNGPIFLRLVSNL
ncbi:MAG: hypothetical protein HY355_05080 [Armatimonadetes bacterium]|nr:hypothetical protein [Armatimonadota bacterium]